MPEADPAAARTPPGFRREVEQAVAAGTAADLALLEEEVRDLDFAWSPDGLRLLEDARRRLAHGPAADASDRVLLFTGHRIDAPGRREPRFPASSERLARRMIREAVIAAAGSEPRRCRGIAGAASGGDILFHEVCARLGVRGEVFLAFDRDAYLEASVADAGAAWVARYERLLARRPVRRLQPSPRLPAWIRAAGRADRYSIWQRANRWMFHHAVAGGEPIVIALWDGREGDGPGGTRDLLETARGMGAPTLVLDARRLVGETQSE